MTGVDYWGRKAGTTSPPKPDLSKPPRWFPKPKPSKPPVPASTSVSAAIIIVGAIAVIDLGVWAGTGKACGPFTQLGEAIGRDTFDYDNERPITIADICAKRHSRMKKNCDRASCSSIAKCSTDLIEKYNQTARCLKDRIWIIKFCDQNNEAVASGWIPNLEGHLTQALGVAQALCNCAAKMRGCEGFPPVVTQETCRNLISKLEQAIKEAKGGK